MFWQERVHILVHSIFAEVVVIGVVLPTLIKHGYHPSKSYAWGRVLGLIPGRHADLHPQVIIKIKNSNISKNLAGLVHAPINDQIMACNSRAVAVPQIRAPFCHDLLQAVIFRLIYP